MITAMAKFRVWARGTLAKVYAPVQKIHRFMRDTVAQVSARIWPVSTLFWKWAGVVASLALLATVAFLCRGTIAMGIGYADTDGLTAGARFFRDFMIGFAAIIGMALAAWRNYALDSQAKTAANQYKLAEDRLLSDRFAVAAELMAKENAGNPAISSRISGIYILESLAKKAPTDFVEQAVKNLIAYVKGHAKQTAKPMPSEEGMRNELHMLGEDVKVAFAVLNNILCDAEMSKMVARDILDFSHQDFSWLNFSEGQVDLAHYKKWAGTNFEGAFLNSANFENADLTATVFSKASLREAQLKGATMLYAMLNGVEMSMATLTNARLNESQMEMANLHLADLRGTSCVDVNFSGANLSNAKMQGGDFSKALFMEGDDGKKTSLCGARLDGAHLYNANLEGADMTSANLWGADLSKADLNDVNLLGVTFHGTQMSGAIVYDDALRESVKAAMNGRIWHSGDEWAEGIETCPNDMDWELEECKDGYALAGVLNNFAERDHELIEQRALELRLQVYDQYMHGDDGLPDDTPEHWEYWVADINPDSGIHPDEINLFNEE